MRTLLLIALLGTTIAWTQAPGPDRDGIPEVIAALNKALDKPDNGAFAALFLKDADLRLGDRLYPGVAAVTIRLSESRRPWSEVTPPRIEEVQIRRLAPDIALVDAAWVQYGSTILRRALPAILVLKQENEEWRVATLRVGVACLMPPGELR
jgi:hypothetical protein